MSPTPPPRVTIVIVADDALVAARLEAQLRDDPAAHVEIASAGQIPGVVAEHPGCIVMLAMGSAGTARALDRLASGSHLPPVIVLSRAPHDAWTTRARRGNVRAVLRHDARADELAAAVAATRAGLLAVHPDVFHAGSMPADASPAVAPVTLTAREIEVLEMMAEGMSNRAIARHLKISTHTVKFHVASVLGKLGARSRTEAVTAGIRHGLISL